MGEGAPDSPLERMTVHQHLDRINELATAIDRDRLNTPFSREDKINQQRRHLGWLHELQAHTLACIEEGYFTIDSLSAVVGGDLHEPLS